MAYGYFSRLDVYGMLIAHVVNDNFCICESFVFRSYKFHTFTILVDEGRLRKKNDRKPVVEGFCISSPYEIFLKGGRINVSF